MFGIAGRIGSGASFVAEKIRHTLYGYRYDVEVIDASTFIMTAWFLSQATDSSPDLAALRAKFDAEYSSPVARTRKLQTLGNELRQRFGKDVIARLAVRDAIAPKLKEVGLGARQAFVIDSLKRPEEVDLLRRIFGGSFCAVGVTATDQKRTERLRERKGYLEDELKELSERDADESDNPFGQRSIKTILRADYYFANEYATKDEVGTEAERLVGLLFGAAVYTPRADEFAMSVAFKAAARSACLSRSVGAALFSKTGALLATGCNDVPEFNGGLYTVESPQDRRCWTFGGKCYNDDEKALIVNELVEALLSEESLWASGGQPARAKVQGIVARSRIKRLIEFSRAVHAEMDAILCIARDSIPGLRGATLYCTTYPCHSCAKHIIASGIERVVYLEPYEKSLARKLHSDALLDTDKGQGRGGLRLDLYNGTAPPQYERFFDSSYGRKEHGRYVDRGSSRQELIPLGSPEEIDVKERIKRSGTWDSEAVPNGLPGRDAESNPRAEQQVGK